MPQEVEINLRIPSLRLPNAETDKPTVILNDALRFISRIEVPSVPKRGEVLTLTTSTGLTFAANVLTANWQDDKNAFVVACRFSRSRISPGDYNALVAATDWEARPLL
jgi:hypothetical protein